MDSYPVFPGFRKPTSDFRAVRADFQTGPLMVELDLTAARSIAANTAAELRFAGNSIYVDQAADVGNATIIFQDDSNIRPARIYMAGGFNFRGPWTRLIIENTAQPGKTLRLFYGVDIDFQPGLNAQVSIAGTVAVQEQGAPYGVAFTNTSAPAANTAIPVFLAAANVNGAVIWAAKARLLDTGAFDSALIAGTVAPVAVTSGDPIAAGYICNSDPGALYWSNLELPRPVRLAAGRGLWFIEDAALSSGYRQCLYTLL